MIKTKQDWKTYLRQDAVAMGLNPDSKIKLFLAYFTNPRWKFIKKLRKAEYYNSQKSNFLYKLLFYFHWYRYKRFGMSLGFSIPINVCGPGLALPHYGTLVISKDSFIGKNARIHVCVNIGARNGGAPKIGDNVYIGPGVKMYGPITIGDNVQIGANAVVNKSFEEDNIVIAGIPAKIIKRL